MSEASSFLEEKVVEYVRQRDHVSFVELERHLEDDIPVKGTFSVEICKNGILWPNVSKEFCSLMVGLLNKKRIFDHPASRMVYLIDGGIPALPSPKNPPKDGIHVGYEQPVWIPVCFRVVPYDPEEEKERDRLDLLEKRNKNQEIKMIANGIGRLVERFGQSNVEKAYVLNRFGDMKSLWIKRHNLKEAKGPLCCMRLIGKRCAYFNARTGRLGKCECKPPASDHATPWTYQGKPAVYVFQPYGLGGTDLEDLLSYCKKWGLQADVDTYPAWHYPGHTLFVAVYPNEGPYHDMKTGKIKLCDLEPGGKS